MKYKQKITRELKTVFVSGTAGSGKSLLTSKLNEYYTKNGAFSAVLNLDPGVENLPYTCDIGESSSTKAKIEKWFLIKMLRSLPSKSTIDEKLKYFHLCFEVMPWNVIGRSGFC